MKHKIVKKAYTVSVSKYDTGYDCDIEEIVYADSPAQAKFSCFRNWEWENIKSLFIIKVKRNKWRDLVENTPHPLVSLLNDRQKHKMLHAIGMEFCDIPTHHRNRYVIEHDADLEALIPHGLINKHKALNMNYYYVTKLGEEVIYSTKPCLRPLND